MVNFFLFIAKYFSYSRDFAKFHSGPKCHFQFFSYYFDDYNCSDALRYPKFTLEPCEKKRASFAVIFTKITISPWWTVQFWSFKDWDGYISHIYATDNDYDWDIWPDGHFVTNICNYILKMRISPVLGQIMELVGYLFWISTSMQLPTHHPNLVVKRPKNDYLTPRYIALHCVLRKTLWQYISRIKGPFWMVPRVF